MRKMTELRERTISMLLLDLLAPRRSLRQGEDRPNLDVVDVGGGTGQVAVILARLGCQVRVIDPNLDALAWLQRRSSEAGLASRIRGIQGDTRDILDIVGAGGTDVVVCHRVPEILDAPTDAMAAISSILRPGGLLSLLVRQQKAAVLTQALAGHIAQARRSFAHPTILDYAAVISLVESCGLRVFDTCGIGAIAYHVTDQALKAEAGARDELFMLENEISRDFAFRALAPELHVAAERPICRAKHPTPQRVVREIDEY
jgi:2-polyprenyl-3-methyl-5-hydroxy-6-metoxy-1,4-benzoquinol methylase